MRGTQQAHGRTGVLQSPLQRIRQDRVIRMVGQKGLQVAHPHLGLWIRVRIVSQCPRHPGRREGQVPRKVSDSQEAGVESCSVAHHPVHQDLGLPLLNQGSVVMNPSLHPRTGRRVQYGEQVVLGAGDPDTLLESRLPDRDLLARQGPPPQRTKPASLAHPHLLGKVWGNPRDPCVALDHHAVVA